MEIELNSLNLEDTKDLAKKLGEKPYRGEQIFQFFNQQDGEKIEDLKLLPAVFRERLKERTYVNIPRILERLDSKTDETKKYLILLSDNNIIETVLMKYEYGYSLCLSSQVGCKMACKFCASTKEGMIRNLTSGEILNQLYLVEKDLNINISNLVLMGSGEPLDNYDNVINFLAIIHDKLGRNISYRNITLSSCGLVPEIYKLAEENIPVTLSISLHSPFDQEREKIMPIGKKYKINEIIEACKYYIMKNNRRITFEYILIDGFNDREKDIRKIIKLMEDLNAHINLIALNPIKEYDRKAPKGRKIKEFASILAKNKIQITIRSEKGSDISGSCGQLRNSYMEDHK